MNKDTLEKLMYYAEYLEGLKTSVQKLESMILHDIQQEKEVQRMKCPELDVIDPEMATW